MKVLWVSLRIFSTEKEKQTAVWLKALAESLANKENIEIINVSKSNSNTVESFHYGNIKQFAIPTKKLNKYGDIDSAAAQNFIKIVNEIKPDIIQIWGTENPFGFLPLTQNLPGIKLLTLQGVLSSMGPCNLRGFTLREIISTIGIREILIGNSILHITKSFFDDVLRENRMIENVQFVLNQSEWTDSQILAVNNQVKLYRTERVLRFEFLGTKKWVNFDHEINKPIIYTSALGYSWKGLHSLLKAAIYLKNYQPNFQLRIAGRYGRTDWLGEGYLRFMLRLIKKHNLQENIIWLGAIDGYQIVNELQNAHVYVNPSFVESYSNALAEAMMIGTPSVVSFAGAMPELADNNKEALFYTPGDHKRCAFLINKLIIDKELSTKLSQNAVIRAEQRNNPIAIAENQYQIYKDLLKNN